MCGGALLLCLLAGCDVDPRPDHIKGLTFAVADQVPLVADPAVAPVFLQKAIFEGLAPLLVQMPKLRFDAWQVIAVNAPAPEIRAFQILTRLIAEHVSEVLTNEGRQEIPTRLEAVDHG